MLAPKTNLRLCSRMCETPRASRTGGAASSWTGTAAPKAQDLPAGEGTTTAAAKAQDLPAGA